MSKVPGYSRLQIGLHWLVAALIVFNYVVSDGMEAAFDSMLQGARIGGPVPVLHVWVGTAVLVLVLLRMAVRLAVGAPEAGNTPAEKAAVWGHRALYALMLAAPALGAIGWFVGVRSIASLHAVAANALMILAAGHAAMAIFHHYVLRDGLLSRMAPLRRG